MANLINKKVKHLGKFGIGTVIDQDETSITVEFPAKTCKFQYPSAFELQSGLQKKQYTM